MALVPDPVYSFSALQRAENSSIPNCAPFPFNAATGFSALQRAENSSILVASAIVRARRAFQCSSASRKFLNLHPLRTPTRTVGSFSALQRAENSSICHTPHFFHLVLLFQCSSASRKFLNGMVTLKGQYVVDEFQCSSASRKFLNHFRSAALESRHRRFSALQRAENSSIPTLAPASIHNFRPR